MKQPEITKQFWLRTIITFLLILGIFFRFFNLDRKVYWHDETYTSLRISGHTNAEMVSQIFNGQEIGVLDLQKYQQLNGDKTLTDTIESLALEDPQHPPLYYIMGHLWLKLFGNSVAVTRSLSAVISLLVFPCAYWLCLELFESTVTAWVAIVLIAISPFHLLYAQEAREYILWIVTILLSSAALLYALRIKTKLSWGLYTLTLIISLYSFTSSILVATGHIIYVFFRERFRFNNTFISSIVAFIISIISFLPWLSLIINKLDKVKGSTDWISEKLSLFTLTKILLSNLSRNFFDWKMSDGNQFVFVIIFIIILIGYSLYFVYRNTPSKVWLFIFVLMGITTLVLLIPDLISGGRRLTVSRYLIPVYLGIQLSVHYTLATNIVSGNLFRRKFAQISLAAIVLCGVISCTISSQSDTWWNKTPNNENIQLAKLINQASYPLLITNNSGSNPGNLLSLSYFLDPKVRLQLVVEPNIPKIPQGFSNIFLWNPSKELQLNLGKNYTIKAIKNYENLWELK